MEFNILTSQIIRAIRNHHSQPQLSRMLGYKFNQVYRWESQAVKIDWSAFVKLCSVCKVPLVENMKNFFSYDGELLDVSVLFKHFIGRTLKKEVAAKIGRSPSMISRWVAGKSEPKLIDVLMLIYASSNTLPEFLNSLLPDDQEILLLRQELDRRESERNLCYSNPILAAIVRCLELDEYEKLSKHREGFFATKLGISVDEERPMIEILTKFQLITLEKGKYKPTSKSLNMSGDFSKNMGVIKFWLERQQKTLDLAQRRGKFPENCFAGYLIFTTNTKTLEKVKSRYVAFTNDMMKDLHSDENRGQLKHVIAFNANFTDLTSP